MIQLKVNGVEQSFGGEPEMPLPWYLRDVLGLTGSKFGCGVGLCGARSFLTYVASDAPRSRGRLRRRKEHERSGPSVAGGPKAAGRGTCSSHCQWQGRNALIQEFARRGSDSHDGFLRSLAASKEIGRILYTAVVATGNGFSSFGREAVEKGGSSWITRKISHAKRMLVIQIPRKIRELMTP